MALNSKFQICNPPSEKLEETKSSDSSSKSSSMSKKQLSGKTVDKIQDAGSKFIIQSSVSL